MATNYSHDGKVVDYENTNTAMIYSGSVVVMGDMIGVANIDIGPGKVGSVSVEGVWRLPKASGTAFALGAAVFWKAADKLVVAASGTDIVPAGKVFADAAAGAATVSVKLNF